jgi:cysteine-rich repeat protein
MIESSWRIAVVLLALLAACGCAEDGALMCGDGTWDLFEECDDGNRISGDGCSADCVLEAEPEPEPDPEVFPTLGSIQENVFTPQCALSECHIPGTAAPMALHTEDDSYQNLVVYPFPSPYCTNPFLRRVQPGEPDRSCLVLKIEASPSAGGDPMPPAPNPPLIQNQIDAIREWITQGAPR